MTEPAAREAWSDADDPEQPSVAGSQESGSKEDAQGGESAGESRSHVAAMEAALSDIGALQGAQRIAALHWALFYLDQIGSEDTLFAAAHVAVGAVMPARNFAIGLAATPGGRLSFDYFVDERETVPPVVDSQSRTLLGYVQRSGHPLLATPQAFDHLQGLGEVGPCETSPGAWLGVPIECHGVVYGVMTVKIYEAPAGFAALDAEALGVVADHLGAVLERRRERLSLEESEERFRSLAETAPCAIFILQQGRICYANGAARALTGRAEAELDGQALAALVHEDYADLVRQRLGDRLESKAVLVRYEVMLPNKGVEVWVELSAGITTRGGRPAIIVAAFDVTERKRYENRVRELAYHDPLTKLPNRLLFEDRVTVALADARRRGSRVALLFLDLDRFKDINDSLGHRAGDDILQQLAARLRAAVRTGDTVARLGGDEFVVLLTNLHQPTEAAAVAQKIADVVREPMQVGGRELFITTSIGISIYPDAATNAEDLVQNADTALYRAKERGRDNCQMFTSALQVLALQRLDLESGLRHAIERGELLLHYQPVLDMRTRRVHGLEALLRWNRPGHGLIGPAEFVSVLESTSLALPVGLWVLRTACQQARVWQLAGHPDLTIAVNLAPRQFQQPDLVASIWLTLQQTGLSARSLVLEITEGQAMQNPDSAVKTLGELRDLGVRIAIDDFGTGYSSLAYLKRLPIHTLKVDRSFVADITHGPGEAAFASAVIVLGHTLKLTVVAEGVETQEQLECLARQHCDLLQGYVYSKPLAVDECQEFLRRHGVPAAERGLHAVPRGRARA